MVTMTDQCRADAGLVVSCDEVEISTKRKSLGLTTSNYSTISIDNKHTVNSCDISEYEARSIAATPKIASSCNTLVLKSAPLQRRHTSLSTKRASTKPTGPPGTSSLHGLKLYNADNRRPPSAKRNSICSPKEQIYKNDFLGSTSETNNTISNSIAGSLADDGVSIVSIGDSINDQSNDNFPERLECSIKVQRESAAITQLLKTSSQQGCICHKTRNSNVCNKASVNVCGWSESRPPKMVKSSISLSRKRPSPPVFSRLVREGKEKTFVFNHHQKVSDYMNQYRNQHTVGHVCDLKRAPPVIGRDVPDPYAMKASNVCLMTEINSINNSFGMVGGKIMVDDTHKWSCPNLSPVRPANSPSFQETEGSTPSQHSISVNDFMETYLPQSTLPYIQKRSDSTLGTGVLTQNCGTESLSSSSQFDGEIVGVKHKLPTATTCNISALCKPSANVEIYSDLKNGLNTYRIFNGMRNKTKKLDMNAKSKNDSQLSSAMTAVVNSDMSNHDESAESNQIIPTGKGCRGCNRITSLIRGQRKNDRHETRAKTFGQCKPLEDQTSNTLYRLQKMPIG